MKCLNEAEVLFCNSNVTVWPGFTFVFELN